MERKKKQKKHNPLIILNGASLGSATGGAGLWGRCCKTVKLGGTQCSHSHAITCLVRRRWWGGVILYSTPHTVSPVSPLANGKEAQLLQSSPQAVLLCVGFFFLFFWYQFGTH